MTASGTIHFHRSIRGYALGWLLAVLAAILASGCIGNQLPDGKGNVVEKSAMIGEAVTLDVGDELAGSEGMSYQWTQTAGPETSLAGASGRQLTFTPDADGEYEFTLTIIDGAGTARVITVRISVSTPSTALRSSAGPDQSILSGRSAVLAGAASGGTPPYQYAWNPVDGLSDPTMARPTVTPTVTTVYTLTVTDSTGTTASDSVTVTVRAPSLEVNVPDTRCISPGGWAEFTAVATGGTPPYQYLWTPSDGLEDPTSPRQLLSTLGIWYRVQVTDAQGVIALSKTMVWVQANPWCTNVLMADTGPDRDIPTGGSIVLAPTITGGTPPYQYAWAPAEGLDDPSSAQPMATPRASTVYTLTVRDSIGVYARSSTMIAVGTAESGAIWSDTTWTLANSPYVVTGVVQIPEGVTLTIEPGVEVQFLNNAQVYTRGAIVAAGTAEQKITFEGVGSASSSPATMIEFVGANLSNSQLSYVSMAKARRAVRLGDEEEYEFSTKPKNTGTLTIAHAEIDWTEIMTAGHQTSARLVLSDCTLRASSVQGQRSESEPIDLVDCTLSDCGITTGEYSKGIALTGSDIQNCVFVVGAGWTDFTSLQHCTLANSRFRGPDLYSGGPLSLDHCTCTNTGIYLPGTEVRISDCDLRYDSAYVSNYGRRVVDGEVKPSSKITLGFGNCLYSTITGNTVGEALTVVGSRWDLSYGPFAMDHCTLQQNQTGVLLDGEPVSVSLTHSNFLTNTVNTVDNRTITAVDAANDYWDTEDAAQISASIHDYFEDIVLGKVTFAPFATAAIPDAGPRP